MAHVGRAMRASSPAVRLVLACLLVAGTASACQAPPDDLIDYVAIGDSHTAAPHTPEGDLTMPCARSDTNYPTELKELLGRTILTDVSCTGAHTDAVREGWDWRDIPMPPQLDAGVGWVDVYEASRGHDICSQTPWINGVTTDLTRANPLHPFPEEQAAWPG
jgi:hypothetical protein